MQFINTAVMCLILRADLPLPVLEDTASEKFSNVSAKWYSIVGGAQKQPYKHSVHAIQCCLVQDECTITFDGAREL